MGHFWASFFDHVKGCGRNATLFLYSLVGFSALLGVAGVIYATGLYQYLWPAIPILVIAALIRLVIVWRQARARRRLRTTFGPLSELELRRARSKLQKGPKPTA